MSNYTKPYLIAFIRNNKPEVTGVWKMNKAQLVETYIKITTDPSFIKKKINQSKNKQLKLNKKKSKINLWL